MEFPSFGKGQEDGELARLAQHCGQLQRSEPFHSQREKSHGSNHTWPILASSLYLLFVPQLSLLRLSLVCPFSPSFPQSDTC